MVLGGRFFLLLQLERCQSGLLSRFAKSVGLIASKGSNPFLSANINGDVANSVIAFVC